MWLTLCFLPGFLAQTANLNGDLTISGSLSCSDLSTSSLTSDGSVQVNRDITVDSVQANSVVTDTLTVRTITPPSGVLRIQGDVVVTRAQTSSFMEITRWKEISVDDFQDGEKGWTQVGVGDCGGEERFLGGYCRSSWQEVNKNYTLPSHGRVRVTANFHMFDGWKGEAGYMKADQKVVWSQSGYSYEKGLDICGGDAPDPKLGIAIDISLEHTSRHLELRFGSTLTSPPCEASYGVDQVTVFIQ